MKRIAIKDYLRESRLFNLRVAIGLALVSVMVLILFARLVYLQIVSHRHYAMLSQENSVKLLPIPPVRGFILDRNGVILAQNFPAGWAPRRPSPSCCTPGRRTCAGTSTCTR